MNAPALIMIVICIAAGVGVVFVLWKLKSCVPMLPVTTTWIDDVSVERYRPMLRLLDGDELRLLGSQPGVTPGRLRRERCQIFREYLHSLTNDFSRVSAALKLVMAQANDDRPDLAALLIRSQATFAACVVLAHVQLALYSLGIGTVNVGELLKVFERMRLKLRTLVPRGEGSAA